MLTYTFRCLNWVFLSNGKNPSYVLRDLDSKETVVLHNTGGMKYIEDSTQNFSSSVEKYFTLLLRSLVKYFQLEKRNFVFPSAHVMFYLLYKHQ